MANPKSILQRSRRFALAGLAAALSTIATADLASAQRSPRTDVWAQSNRSIVQRSCPPVTTVRNGRSGSYETRYERVWIPATTRREWVPARHGFRYLPCGTRVRYVIAEGHYRHVHVPGFYDTQAVQVWVPVRRQVVQRTRRAHRVSHVGRRR